MYIYIYMFFGVPVDMSLCKKTVSWKKENRTRNVFDHKMLEGLTKASCDELFLRNFFGPRMCVWLARKRCFWEIMGRWKIRRDVFVFSVWGSFPSYLLHFGAKISDLRAICCILELKYPICMLHLAFGLRLLAFGFGFTWLLAFGFGFWPHFCWMYV